MQDQKYSSYADIPALEQETAKILAMFDSVESGVGKLSSLGIKINAADSAKQVDKLKKEYDELSVALDKQKKQLVDLAAKLVASTSEEAKQAEALKQTTALVKGLTAEQIKNQKIRQGEYATLQEAKQANNELNKSIQLRIKLRNAEEGSIEQMSFRYQKLSGIITKLSAAQRDSARGQNLIKQADQLKDKINVLQKGIGNFSANVGRYSESLGGLFGSVRDEISKLQVKQADLIKQQNANPIGFQVGGGENNLAQVTAQIDKLNGVQQIGFKTGQSYYQTVRQIERAYSDLATTPGIDGEFLNKFKQEAAEAKDNAADLKDEIKALSSDTRNLDLAVGTISVLASGFEAAAGAAALFGADTDDVAKVTQKLVAVQSVANGIREVGAQITQRGTAANKAYNFVVQQGTVLFAKGSTAAQRFGAALKGIVILAVIGAIFKLVEAMTEANKATGDWSESLRVLNQDLAELEIDSNRALKTVQNTNALRLASLKARGASEKEISAATIQGMRDEQVEMDKLAHASLRTYNATIGQTKGEIKSLDDITTKLKFARDAKAFYYEEQQAQGQKVDEERVARYDSEIQGLEKIQSAYDNVSQKGTDIQLALTGQQEEAYKKRKKQIEDEKTAALELLKFREGLIVEEANLSAGEDSPNSVKFKVAAAQKAFDAEKKILNAQKAYDLAQEELAASQKLLIDEKYADDLYKLELDLSGKIVKIYALEAQRRQADMAEALTQYEQDQADSIAKQAELRQKGFEKEQSQIETFRSEELRINIENFEKGLKTEAQFKVRQEEIEIDYQKRKLQSQLRFYQAELELLQRNGDDTTAALEQIAAIKAQMAQLGVDVTLKGIEEEKAALASLKEKYEELGEALQNTFEAAIQGVFDRRKNQLQDLIDKNDELKEKEIDRISKSGEAEDVRANKIKIVEAAAQARREALERRQRQIDRQKALFERGTKVFEIVTDNITAVNKIKVAAAAAVNPVIKGLLLSQIPITIATGAAGLLTLLSTPIPKYRAGTDFAKGGPSEVAEEGRELGVEPGGKVRMFNKRAIYDIKRGTKIYTHRVTEDIMRAANNDMLHPSLGVSEKENDPRLTDIVYELKRLNDKPPMAIYNAPDITTTPWFKSNFKN